MGSDAGTLPSRMSSLPPHSRILDSGSTPVTVIAYGSLMSVYGRSRHAEVRTLDLHRVQLLDSRRGFGKASIHADRFAMVLEPRDLRRPLAAIPLGSGDTGEPPQGVALRLAAGQLPAVASREGYSVEALARLTALADAAGSDLPAYLDTVMAEGGGDIVAYRRALRARSGYTSPHYIPHPIAIGDGPPGIVFLAAGAEGSGDPGVVPVRVRSGCCELMTVAEVWRRKPNTAQLDYIAMCLLGAAGGVRVDDLLTVIPDDLRRRLNERFADRPDDLAILRPLLG